MSEHGLCPTCGRCLCCGLDQKPKVEPAVPFKPVAADWWKHMVFNDHTAQAAQRVTVGIDHPDVYLLDVIKSTQ